MENPVDEIIEYLFVGNAKSLLNPRYDMIVNCTKDIPFPTSQNAICIRLPINDNPDECTKFLYEINNTYVLEHIDYHIKNKRSVLVHCSMGIQRSCALVACYLVKYNRWTPTEAIAFIKTKRPIAFFGKVNFLETIEAFSKELQYNQMEFHKDNRY